MAKKPDKFKIAAGILGSALFFAAYQFYDFYTVDVARMEAERSGRQAELGVRQRELKKLQEFARNIQTIKNEFRELNYQLESALEHMPKTFNLSALLRRLTLLAQNSGVELKSFRPKKDDTKVTGFYATIPIELDIRGPYTQTLVFFDQVSRLKRIVSVDAVTMKAGTASTKSGAVMTETTAAVRTYRFAE